MLNTHLTNTVTAAEYLLAMAESIKHPIGEVMVAQPGMTDWQLAQCRLAMGLDTKPEWFKFRAVYEEWSQFDIVRELY